MTRCRGAWEAEAEDLNGLWGISSLQADAPKPSVSGTTSQNVLHPPNQLTTSLSLTSGTPPGHRTIARSMCMPWRASTAQKIDLRCDHLGHARRELCLFGHSPACVPLGTEPCALVLRITMVLNLGLIRLSRSVHCSHLNYVSKECETAPLWSV